MRVENWTPLSPEPPHGAWGLNFGGGVNSTALLLYCHEKGLVPAWTVFADTGSERPETYRNIEIVQKWCEDVGFPFYTVRWIRKDGSFESVHDNCLRTSYLPSKAYGYAGCTWKWKIYPMTKWRKQMGLEDSTVAIGYDAGEKRRLNKVKRLCDDAEYDPEMNKFWYPLAAWGIDRTGCEEIIKKQGWPTVKSSCFMCPHMRKEEWQSLNDEHPDLFRIAVKIEDQAKAAGHADTASIFRRAGGTCLCLADQCMISDES